MRFLLSAIRYFDRQPRLVILAIALGVLAGVGLVHALAAQGESYDMVLALAYLAPVCFTAWHAGSRWGAIASLAAATISTIAAAFGPAGGAETGDRQLLVYGSGLLRLGAFLLASLLVSALRLAQDRAVGLARTDSLTGVGNLRWFREQLDREIHRCERYRRPFTVLYGDLDHFKPINDRLGHVVGDALLREVAAALQRAVRGADVVARLGGDEFGILLPETDSGAGSVVAGELRREVMDTVTLHGWPVGISFGVVTCVDPPASVDAVLGFADELMYAAKREEGSGIRHADLIASRQVQDSLAGGL